MKKEKERHEVAMAALACIRCTCGWESKIEKLRSASGSWKSDEDLCIESGQAFERHKKSKGDS